MIIVDFEEKYSEIWDDFIFKQSVNGTFLQTRKFLSYHPSGRFRDGSFLIEDKGKIIAVCPACIEESDGKNMLISHRGSTYGGLIVSAQVYKTNKILDIIQTAENYLQNKGFRKLVYKITPDIFSKYTSDLLCFCLGHIGYRERQELNFYIDFDKYEKEIMQNFDNGRKGNVKNCMKAGMTERQIYTNEELDEFYNLLCYTLKKYSLHPVHSYQELCLLRDMFLDEVSFMGIFMSGKMAGGAMLFHFNQTKCIHVQYLASDPKLNKLSPMSFLYYSIISYAMKQKVRYLSWGIATDHEGNLNMGLIHAKEAVGSIQAINRVFEKEW